MVEDFMHDFGQNDEDLSSLSAMLSQISQVVGVPRRNFKRPILSCVSFRFGQAVLCGVQCRDLGMPFVFF